MSEQMCSPHPRTLEHEGLSLAPMNRARMHEYFRCFIPDPSLFLDPAECRPFSYDAAWVDAFFDARQRRGDCVFFAILLEGAVIGDVGIKHVDPERASGELTIHLTHDGVKNRGFGTWAEGRMLEYAFEHLKLQTVTADAVLTNGRSQHVLEKLGFHQSGEDESFRYYQLKREDFI